MFSFLKKLIGSQQDRKVGKFRKIVQLINKEEEKLQSLSDEELRAKTDAFKKRLFEGESVDNLLIEAYAVVKNTCRRLCGTEVHVSGYNQKWDMIPFDVQLIGAIALHKGHIAEMQTGEGKTLTAVFPLYLNALTEKAVHLVTVNDYLASRDCEWVGVVLRWHGLTTGALTNDTPLEERKKVYECDVVYGTASEFGFDYLRDNSMASHKEQQVQRGHYFAIIDEVDSVLIDEARTPLIISGSSPISRHTYSELKYGVDALVRKQRDHCNKIATDATKILKPYLNDEPLALPKSKEEKVKIEEALRSFWLVNKGTPRNKLLKRVLEHPDLRAEIDRWDLYFYSDQNKDEKKEALATLYLMVDEKSSDFELTDKGIAFWNEYNRSDAAYDDFSMMDIVDEYLKIDHDTRLDKDAQMEAKLRIQEEDAKRKERAHNLRQLLRAHLTMEKDVEYIVHEGKIVIIDENTGRPQPGRRFSDGLHQAIEAKEGVEIQQETQTYATITLQNYFRMYEKIAGMTGTATTEALEFKQTYKLDVLEIPTHKLCARTDFNDEIYMSEREKYHAIMKQVQEVHKQGRPILIGTDSVEASEKLSRIFRQNGLAHTVLNARHHEKEAEIIALAGQESAVTIATNMAGRGTDIKLGKEVAEKGGLHVIGTTRHQSRRIDRQLRGRCARQGDPGSSIFYLSFEDSLLRLFASRGMTQMLQKFRPPEGEPISAGILNKSIETAQKRIEQRNSTIRKHTLEYDDVMNKQRQEIYNFRGEVLHTKDPVSLAKELVETVIYTKAQECFPNQDRSLWNIEEFTEWAMKYFPITFDAKELENEKLSSDEMESFVVKRVLKSLERKLDHQLQKIAIPGKIASIVPDANYHIDEAVRNIIVRRIDEMWIEHLHTMDHLRHEVSLRTVGQRDPLMEFKHEAFRLFDEFGQELRSSIVHDLFRFEMVPSDPKAIEKLLAKMQMETTRSFVDGEEAPTKPGSKKQKETSAFLS